jgi:hypothetical protein
MKRSILIVGLIVALLLTACGGGAAPAVDATSGAPAADGGAGDGAAPADVGAPKPLDKQFTIDIGQTATLEDGTTIKFDSVVEDSRCARDVECATAGQITVSMTVTVGGTPQVITVTQNSEASVNTAVGGYNIELISVRPTAKSTDPIAPDEYRVQLVVTKPG